MNTQFSSRIFDKPLWCTIGPMGTLNDPPQKTCCFILAQHYLVLQLKQYMIGPSLLTVAQLACNFGASLALNGSSYQNPCLAGPSRYPTYVIQIPIMNTIQKKILVNLVNSRNSQKLLCQFLHLIFCTAMALRLSVYLSGLHSNSSWLIAIITQSL